MNFRNFLIEKINNSQNEADIVLHQVINNVDDSHIDYSDARLDFNIGIMVKRSSYTKLYMTILNSDTEFVKLAKNNQKDGHTIVVSTSSYPDRMTIDDFLSSKGAYNKVKAEVINFIDQYKNDEIEFKTEYESAKEINNPKNFEKLYNIVIENMKRRIEEYKSVASDINAQIDNTAHEGQKQILVRSLDKLKEEYFGDTFKKFKKIAAEAIDVDLTRFEKEYKKKFDDRLENFYEYVINL